MTPEDEKQALENEIRQLREQIDRLNQKVLTEQEIRHLREIMQSDDRATWARKQIKVFGPWMVGVVVGIWQFWNWAYAHFKP